MGGLGESARSDVPESAALGEENPSAAAQVLAELVGTYRAEREADWCELCRGPLEAAVGELTSVHGPRRLEADRAAWVKRTMARFARLFPEAYAAVRLCGAESGLQAIVGMLATAEVTAEAWREAEVERADPNREVIRRCADARDEAVRAYRSPLKRDVRWVV